MWIPPTSSPPSWATRPSGSVVCSTRPPGRSRASSNDDVDARPIQVAGRREPAEASADDDDVGHRRRSSPSFRTIAPTRERSVSASSSWPGTVSASSQWFMRTSAT